MFKVQRNKNIETSINLTPLIDVVFLLLIFFMVSTTFKKNALFEVNLPTVKDVPNKLTQSQDLELLVKQNGDYVLNQVTYNRNNLANFLKELKQDKLANTGDQLSITILGDNKSTHQAIIGALEAASLAGINQINLMAVSES